MTNWIKLFKGDSYIEIIKGHLGGPNSFEWFGETTFHAWLDIDTSNWVAVYSEGEDDNMFHGERLVRTYVFIGGSETPLTFSRRLNLRYMNDSEAETYAKPVFAAALNAVAEEAVRTLHLEPNQA